MKAYFTSLACCLIIPFLNLHAQQTLTLQPGAADGKDSFVWSNAGSTIYFGDHPSCIIYAWTNSGQLGIKRGLIEFDLSQLPPNAVVSDARLSLYHNPNESDATGEHSGSNAAYIQRITSSWSESTVHWSNQPSTTTQNQVSVPSSSSGTQDYLNIDVTDLVMDMLNDPFNSHGFLIKLQTEQTYRGIILASSDNSNSSLHPKLEITYTAGTIDCVTMKPAANEGKDATIWNNAGPNLYLGDHESNIIYGWSNQGSPGVKRALIDFDLSVIPNWSTITEAKLSLYHNPDETDATGQHSGNNSAVIQRITSAWDEMTVHWNNQPSSTSQNEVNLPASSSGTQDYLDVDVTDLVADMYNDQANSHGFLIKLVTEQAYRSLIFASSDHTNASLHPKLEVCYSYNTSVVEGLKAQKSFQIYPNPSSGWVFIKIEKEAFEDGILHLFNNLGQLVLSQNYSGSAIQLDLNSLPKGIYTARLGDTSGQTVSRKIVLQ